MRLGLTLTIYLSFFGFATHASPSPNSKDSILIVSSGGPYHGDEIKAASGPGWFGLYQKDSGFELRPVALSIAMVNDPIIDTKPEQKSGKLISVVPESKQKGVIFLKPNDSIKLKEGMIEGTFFEVGTTVYPGQSQLLKVGENHYSLAAAGEASLDPGSSQSVIKNYSLHLFFRQQSQLLFSEKGSLGHDGRPQIIWAGDLDRDGKLDLLLNLTTHYNTTRLVLFLSSQAKSENLIEVVGELTTTGC